MFVTDAVLHLLCGRISAGKSTPAASLAARPGTILVREDQWLAGLYPGEQNSLDDDVRNTGRLRGVMGPHLVALLRAGVSVVLDFSANTPQSRAWMRSVVHAAEAAHQLHYLKADATPCAKRACGRATPPARTNSRSATSSSTCSLATSCRPGRRRGSWSCGIRRRVGERTLTRRGRPSLGASSCQPSVQPPCHSGAAQRSPESRHAGE